VADWASKEVPIPGNPVKLVAKGGKTIGWAGEALSIGINTRNLAVNPNFGNVSRLQVSVLIASTNLIPGVGTGLSFGLSVVDASGGFNWLYNTMDKYEAWYNENNLKLGNFYIPNNLKNPSGPPVFSITFY